VIGPTSSAAQILSAIPDAEPDNATVLVVEDLMPEEQSGPRVSTLDVMPAARSPSWPLSQGRPPTTTRSAFDLLYTRATLIKNC
jgi:hypothetical protein